MTLWVGLDCGSWATKAVVIADDATVLGTAVTRSGADLVGAADRALTGALRAAGRKRTEVQAVWATGFGRHALTQADGSRTELDCHGRGAAFFVSGPLVVIDIGGQDAKVIHLDPEGRRLGHRMNRKCAAGTGSFLEEIALRLGIESADLDRLALEATEPLDLSSFCTVFAGTELLALIRAGKRPADLALAAYRSLVKRVAAMDVFPGKVVATGGVVAYHPTLVGLLGKELRAEVIVPPLPQMIGAFGAALAAREGAVAVGPSIGGSDAD